MHLNDCTHPAFSSWITDLTRAPSSPDSYVHVSGYSVRVVESRARGVLDALIAARAGHAAHAMPRDERMEAELRNLWDARLIAPLADMQRGG